MAGTFASLIVSGVVFHGSHVVLSSTRLRGNLRDQLGERGYLALYSVVALATFAWFVTAYIHAPTVVLWRFAPWTVFIPLVTMPVASILLIAGYSTPNPTAVGMERVAGDDDPAPGIMRVTRHPIMWANGLWGLSHVAPNGDLASLLFFGSLATLALGRTRLRLHEIGMLRVVAGLLLYAVLLLAHPLYTGHVIVVP